MMRQSFMSLLLVILCICTNSEASCGSSKVSLFFANGMFNDRAGAYESLIYLWGSYSKKFPESKATQYSIAFNTNEPFLQQLHQVYKQKAKESNLSFWKSFSFLLSKMGQDEYRNFIRNIVNEDMAKDQDLKEQVRAYKDKLSNGYRVVTIAHSQGNFYTLFSFEELGNDSLRMISVATPASYVFGEGPYFTFHSDGVISHIPNSLPPNINKEPSGIFDHEFINHYMKDKGASEHILESIKVAIDRKGEDPPHTINPADGYFNTDMSKALEWTQNIIISDEKLSEGVCILAQSVFSVSGLHGRSCEGRNFTMLEQSVRDCGKPDNPEGGETNCPFYRGMDFGNPYIGFYAPESNDFYQKHPECVLTYNEFKKIKKSGGKKAVEILNTLRM